MVTCIDQLSGGGQYPHEDCAESCVISIKADDGKADTERLEEQWDMLHGDNPCDGTGGTVHVDSLVAAGIPARIDRRMTGEVLADARARGLNRVMVAVFSDHSGYPTPQSGLGHWILWTGNEDYMQPVGGHAVYYPDELVEAASQNYHVVVDRPIGAGLGGDEPMTPQERQQVATVLSLLIRNQYLSPHTVKRVSSIDEVNGTAHDMLARGFDAGMWAVIGSDEAKRAQTG